jgi:hypothetical protein
LFGLQFDPEDGGYTFFQNIWHFYRTTRRYILVLFLMSDKNSSAEDKSIWA